MKYGQIISVEVKVSKLKSSSFELEYELKNEAGKECTVVKTVHVFVDKSTWKKRDIEKDVKQGLQKYYIGKEGTN